MPSKFNSLVDKIDSLAKEKETSKSSGEPDSKPVKVTRGIPSTYELLDLDKLHSRGCNKATGEGLRIAMIGQVAGFSNSTEVPKEFACPIFTHENFTLYTTEMFTGVTDADWDDKLDCYFVDLPVSFGRWFPNCKKNFVDVLAFYNKADAETFKTSWSNAVEYWSFMWSMQEASEVDESVSFLDSLKKAGEDIKEWTVKRKWPLIKFAIGIASLATAAGLIVSISHPKSPLCFMHHIFPDAEVYKPLKFQAELAALQEGKTRGDRIKDNTRRNNEYREREEMHKLKNRVRNIRTQDDYDDVFEELYNTFDAELEVWEDRIKHSTKDYQNEYSQWKEVWDELFQDYYSAGNQNHFVNKYTPKVQSRKLPSRFSDLKARSAQSKPYEKKIEKKVRFAEEVEIKSILKTPPVSPIKSSQSGSSGSSSDSGSPKSRRSRSPKRSKSPPRKEAAKPKSKDFTKRCNCCQTVIKKPKKGQHLCRECWELKAHIVMGPKKQAQSVSKYTPKHADLLLGSVVTMFHPESTQNTKVWGTLVRTELPDGKFWVITEHQLDGKAYVMSGSKKIVLKELPWTYVDNGGGLRSYYKLPLSALAIEGVSMTLKYKPTLVGEVFAGCLIGTDPATGKITIGPTDCEEKNGFIVYDTTTANHYCGSALVDGDGNLRSIHTHSYGPNILGGNNFGTCLN